MPDQLELVTAALVDHYAVERELGTGGMATVYLARDLKHGRMVAVKVLHPDLAASLGAERFLREIQITAKLSHPHILPLYDSGAAEGFLYYVMPFVEGESLGARIEREKQLPIRDAVDITREVAQALGHAHSLGLVHRDIKPDNIMLSGGHAVIADFGIARALDAASGEKLTQTGMAVGTPAYMSPEQAAGDVEVDGRSDLYSLGCVLYEMLVGQMPFTGPTPMAIMARHTMDTVPPPTIMRQAIPDELEDVIMTAMAKAPADRYRTCNEMADALAAVDTHTAMHRRPSVAGQRRSAVMVGRAALTPRRWHRAAVPAAVAVLVLVGGLIGWRVLRGGRSGTGVETLDPRRVAVLYFEDLSRNASLGYVGDGLAEALIERLASVPQLTVLSRDAVAPYRETSVSRDSIGHALQAGSLVTGSVEPTGERIRLTVRLVDGFSGSDIETRTVELPSANLLAVRDSAAEVVSGFLRRRLGESILLRERRRGTRVVEAWTLVQQAERARKLGSELRLRDRDATRRTYQEADSLLALAEKADPRWAEAGVLRGWVAYDLSGLTRESHEAAALLRTAIGYADRAGALDSRDAEALHLRGRSRYRLWLLAASPDPAEQAKLLDAAQADLETAVKVDPALANAWYVLSILYYDKKDNVAAALAAERAYESDAFLRFQDNNLNQLFQTHYDLEQFPNAQRWCDEGGRRFPGDRRFVTCQLMMLITPWAPPNVARAWALARRMDTLLTQAPDSALAARDTRFFVGGVLARASLPDSARNVLLAGRAGRDLDPEQRLAVREAVMRVLLGDYDEAVELWRRYVLANPTHKIELSRDLHWWWRPLRDHAGFRAVAGPSP